MVALTLASPVQVINAKYNSFCKCCGKPITAKVDSVARCVNPLREGGKDWWIHESCVAMNYEVTPPASVTTIPELPATDCHVNRIFSRVLELASARKNVFIPGPTGCGKTHLVQQVAEALGMRFGFISCSAGMSEGQLTGRLLPTGEAGRFEYVISEFVDCYENGGIFLLDEVDAADANVLLVINAALANGKMALANRPEKPYAVRHPDFVCIAAANTWGNGADRQYCGRNQLDNATLDRFRIGQVAMDYDNDVECKLCPNVELFNRLHDIRTKAREARLERAVSTRFIIDAYDMVTKMGWSIAQVEEALFADWRKDEIAKIQ